MDNTVVTALITGGVTSLGSILGFIGTMSAQKKKSIEAHTQATEAFKESIEEKLDKHREEYLKEISVINQIIKQNSDEITEMKSQSQTFQATMELKFDNLDEKVMKHNNLVKRMQKAELDIAILQQRDKIRDNAV